MQIRIAGTVVFQIIQRLLTQYRQQRCTKSA